MDYEMDCEMYYEMYSSFGSKWNYENQILYK
jgi:hypothetical protein